LVSKAMDNEFWISQIYTHGGVTVEHIAQFTKLWEMAQNVQMDNDTPDKITCKLSNDGSYSSKSAYKLQFQIHVISLMPSLVWKPWAPPKCKIFAWLIIQNRMCTTYRLYIRGWQNFGLCKLCNQTQDSSTHLLFKCRFTIRVWSTLKVWLVLYDVDPTNWHVMHTVKEWWM
jgi:hypothetical protein